MIQWKTVEPDAKPRDLAAVLGRLPLLDTLFAAAVLSQAPLVLFTDDARRTIRTHVAARREESGGLLLGTAAVPSSRLSGAIPFPIVSVTEAVPSENYEGTSVSLRIDPSVWTSAMPRKNAGLLVVGWFHSHPNLGAFFSGTDCATQRSFFRNEYSLGYVIDPIRDDHAYFIGPNSEEVEEQHVVAIKNNAALPESLRC
jgi:proteasome lid subunit RPN8/RPN11